MTLPLAHEKSYMHLVSSQLAIPPTQSIYESAKRSTIAGLRRKRFAIVATSPYLNLPLRSLEQARLERHGL
jgi:hypothetical protein